MLSDNLVFAYCVRGDTQRLQNAFLAGQTFTMADEDLQTPLHLATLHRRHSIMKVLLQTVIPMEARNIHNDTPFSIAVSNVDVGAAKMLLHHRAQVRGLFGRRQEPCLHIAIQCDLSEGCPMVRWLLSLGADPEEADTQGTTALELAVQLNRPSAVVLCLFSLNKRVWLSGGNPKVPESPYDDVNAEYAESWLP
eukprot:PhF_6_TR9102/c0_g1_i1/m.14170